MNAAEVAPGSRATVGDRLQFRAEGDLQLAWAALIDTLVIRGRRGAGLELQVELVVLVGQGRLGQTLEVERE